MSGEKGQAKALRLALVGAISELPKPDQAAVLGAAQKIRDAIEEANTQEDGLGLMAVGLISAELQEKAS